MKQQDKSKLGRRDFLRAMGAGAGLAVTVIESSATSSIFSSFGGAWLGVDCANAVWALSVKRRAGTRMEVRVMMDRLRVKNGCEKPSNFYV